MMKNIKAGNLCQVEVEFINHLPIEEVVTILSRLQMPQVVIWCVGYNGLKKAGVDFYRDFLIYPVLHKDEKATFWLVDLTAWGAFKTPRCSIYNFSHACELIDSLSHKQIKCIKTSKIFETVQKNSR